MALQSRKVIKMGGLASSLGRYAKKKKRLNLVVVAVWEVAIFSGRITTKTINWERGDNAGEGEWKALLGGEGGARKEREKRLKKKSQRRRHNKANLSPSPNFFVWVAR